MSEQPGALGAKGQEEGMDGFSGAVGDRSQVEQDTAHPLFLSPQDMRKHVTMTLLDTEQSYVESLRTLMQVRGPQLRPWWCHSESGR